MMLSVWQFLIPSALLVLGGAVIFGLYYLLYKRILKKQGSITNESFIVKAPLFIGGINIVSWVCLLISIIFGVGYVPTFIPDIVVKIFFVLSRIFLCYIILSVPLSIASIAITFVFYKKQLIAKNKLLGIVLGYSIYVVIILAFTYLMLCTDFLYMT